MESSRNTTEISLGSELARKTLHLAVLVIPVLMLWLGRPAAFYLLAPLAAVAVCADLARRRWSVFATFIDRWFGFMMRPTERDPTSRVYLNGATWMVVSAAILSILFEPMLAATALTVCVIADAAAAVVGRRFGRRNWGRLDRTVEGSVAFAVVGVLVFLFFPFPIWMGALVAMGAAFAEALPGPLNDNLRVPLVAATLLFILVNLAPPA